MVQASIKKHETVVDQEIRFSKKVFRVEKVEGDSIKKTDPQEERLKERKTTQGGKNPWRIIKKVYSIHFNLLHHEEK